MRKNEARQFSLPLTPSTSSGRTGAVEVTEGLLREAWRRSRLRIDFEEAMQMPHFRTCLGHVATNLAGKGLRK